MATGTVATYSGRGIIWNRMKGAGAEAKNIGWGTGNAGAITAVAATDVNLFAPAPEARTAGTSSIITTTSLGDTYQVTGTIVATAARSITEAGLFDAATPLSPTSTVSNSLSAAGTSVTAGTSLAGAAGNYYAQIENEVILVTGAAAISFTVTRGVLGTVSAVHAIGTPITMGGDGGGAGWTTSQTVNSASMAGSYGGNIFIHSTFGLISLNSADSISFTFSDTLTGLLVLGLSSLLSAALGIGALIS